MPTDAVDDLGPHAAAYEQRAAYYMRKYNLGVVDVGVANDHYPATTLADIQEYVTNTKGNASATTSSG